MTDDLPVLSSAGVLPLPMEFWTGADRSSCRRHPAPDVRRFFYAVALLAAKASRVASNASMIDA